MALTHAGGGEEEDIIQHRARARRNSQRDGTNTLSQDGEEDEEEFIQNRACVSHKMELRHTVAQALTGQPTRSAGRGELFNQS